MSRPLRLEFPNALYHVTSRGDRRENIYDDSTDKELFRSTLARVINQFNWVCYAYCLMDNHYHLLIQTPDGNLSKGMRQLNGVYTQTYNRRHSKVGHLFQGRYKSILVDEEAYLLELSRYIVLNPVKAHLVKHVGDWPWSSYPAMTGLSEKPDWLCVDDVLLQFSKQRKTAIRKYKEFVTAGLKEGPIWNRLNNQIYLGESTFINKVQQHLKDQRTDLQIPKVQKRTIANSIAEYENQSTTRDDAIIEAYASGAYSYQALAEHFGLHFTTIGRIVRQRAKAWT